MCYPNGHYLIIDGGEIDDTIKESLGEYIKYTPSITTDAIPEGTMNQKYTEFSLTADGTTPSHGLSIAVRCRKVCRYLETVRFQVHQLRWATLTLLLKQLMTLELTEESTCLQ